MIIRRKHNSAFTIVPNRILVDDRLSAEARWLMAYLLSKPDDWELRVPDIQAAGKVGRDKAYRLVSECVEAGYITRDVDKDHQGKVLGHVYIVRDEPLPEKPEGVSQNRDAEPPLPEKPDTAEPDTGNQDHTKDGESPRTEATLEGGPLDHDSLAKRLSEAGGNALDPTSTGLIVLSDPLRWLREGCDLDQDILPVIRARTARRRAHSIRTWGFFTGAVFEARDRRLSGAPDAVPNARRDPYSSRVDQGRLQEIAREMDRQQ